MRGLGLIAMLIALLLGGLVYAKRLKTLPKAPSGAGYIGSDGKPVKNLNDLPKDLEKQLNDQLRQASKATIDAGDGDEK